MNTPNIDLQNALKEEKQLIFYKIMRYPIPKDWNFFLYNEKLISSKVEIQRLGQLKEEGLSRTSENPYLEEYRAFILKYRRLYRNIPFVKSIYLCNSISFNALHEDSDIDIFIITRKNALRRARFASELYFRLLFLKRGMKNKRKKFCLSFYITQDKQNLYNISLPQSDIYLVYRLAHLVPLYQETYENIYKYNSWMQGVLPNFPGRQIIDIGIAPEYWRSRWKKIQEFFCGGIRGRAVEMLVKYARLPLVIYKKNKLGKNGWGIIINNSMLKFHRDKRRKIHLLYRIYLKRYQEKHLFRK